MLRFNTLITSLMADYSMWVFNASYVSKERVISTYLNNILLKQKGQYMWTCCYANATYCFVNWMEMSSSNSPTEAISYAFHSPDGVATTATNTHCINFGWLGISCSRVSRNKLYMLHCLVHHRTDGRSVEWDGVHVSTICGERLVVSRGE